jgi:hypothetical protein
MGLFKSLFGGNNTPETEKEKNDKKNFEILKYDGIRAQRMGKLPYAIKCFEEAVAINDELETLSLLSLYPAGKGFGCMSGQFETFVVARLSRACIYA